MDAIIINVLRTNLKFGLMSFDTGPRTSIPFQNSLKVDALTQFQEDIKIFISHQLIAPLLRDDLTEGERMAERVYVAKTICHELMHVFNFASQNFSREGKYLGVNRYCNFEPYFEEGSETEFVSLPFPFCRAQTDIK